MNVHRVCIIAALALVVATSAFGQSWELAKVKDSVRIYTRSLPGRTLLSFKAVTRMQASAREVYTLLEDVHQTDWWEKRITKVDVLNYQKDKSAQYYLVFDLPWPFTDRDLCVKIVDSINLRKEEYKVVASPLPGVIAEKKNLVRIRNYRQAWTIKPLEKTTSLVEVEGFVDPEGKVPDWMFNLILLEIPLNDIRGLRQKLER